MKIFQVVRPLVATQRISGLEHKHLKVINDGKADFVAIDAVGCIPGDWVIGVGSAAAREAAGRDKFPSDLTIVGIIDHWPPEGYGEEEAENGGEPEGTGEAQGAGEDK